MGRESAHAQQATHVFNGGGWERYASKLSFPSAIENASLDTAFT